MAITRQQLQKELLPGLNALFGLEYKRYPEEWKEIYEANKDKIKDPDHIEPGWKLKIPV